MNSSNISIMNLPIELWNLIINTPEFDIKKKIDIRKYKSCILVNSLFYKIITNITNKLPNEIILTIRHQQYTDKKNQWFYCADHKFAKITNRQIHDNKLVIHKNDILLTKLIRFPTQFNYFVDVPLIPQILNAIFHDDYGHCNYINIVLSNSHTLTNYSKD